LRVVLVNSRNPLNIGAVARAMSNFGFHCLRVVNPYDVAFQNARSAVGASHVLAAAEQYSSVAEAVADSALVVGTTAVRHRDLQHPLHELNAAGGKLIRQQLQSAPVTVMFGSERFGLSNEELSHCHWLLRIRTEAEQISMNLGHAVAVCLYELVRGGSVEKPGEIPALASAEEIERLTTVLLETLRDSGYVNRGTEATTEEKTRRMIRRLRLQSGDSEALLGMMRQILWKLRSEK
jgi:tRNA/rRNA methyltransferase